MPVTDQMEVTYVFTFVLCFACRVTNQMKL
jgi:hypothetical protein